MGHQGLEGRQEVLLCVLGWGGVGGGLWDEGRFHCLDCLREGWVGRLARWDLVGCGCGVWLRSAAGLCGLRGGRCRELRCVGS